MKRTTLTRIGTLAGFAILMSGFVAYRSGAFDKLLEGHGKATTTSLILSAIIDTTKKPVTPPRDPTTMSSSKSMILTDINLHPIVSPTFFLIDTVKLLALYQRLVWGQQVNQQSKDQTMMSSSKSAPIIKPRDLKVFIDGKETMLKPAQVDSLIDVIRTTYPEIIYADSIKKAKPIMSSSKSGVIFTPRDLHTADSNKKPGN